MYSLSFSSLGQGGQSVANLEILPAGDATSSPITFVVFDPTSSHITSSQPGTPRMLYSCNGITVRYTALATISSSAFNLTASVSMNDLDVRVLTYTGASQLVNVPSYVTKASIAMAGASGGSANACGQPGLGASLWVMGFPIAKGSTLQVNVGGRGKDYGNNSPTGVGSGGFNGGGAGGWRASWSGSPTDHNPIGAGGGGGASDIRAAPYSLSDRFIVAAGGGGGSGCSRGGDGGEPNGKAGNPPKDCSCGGTVIAGGGTTTSGGKGAGQPGTLGQG